MKTTARLLLSGLVAFAITFSSFAQTSLHYWDFNNTAPWPSPTAATQTIGGGSLTHAYTGTMAFGGSTLDAPGFTSVANNSFSVVGSANNGLAFILAMPTTGYQGIKLTYATRGTGTGYTTHTIDYTTDGTNYTNIATITGRTSTSFSLQTVDFTSITAANDNPNFKIRITVSGATDPSGNNRFDNIRLTGTLIPVSNSMSVSGTGDATEGGAAGSFNMGLSPTTTGSVTVDYALTGTATFNTDYTVSFTGATSNSSTSSGTLTIPSGTSSVTATITPIDDASIETTETVVLTLSNPGGSYTLSLPSASINLIDNDVATISFTGNYTQDFNTLSNTALSSTLPQGWLFSESGTATNTTYGVDDGGNTAGNTYSYGSSASTDRALGSLRSNALASVIGAAITNNTGSTLGSFQITYTGEQWRLGATGRSDKYDFQYSLNATSLTNGTWIDADGLDFIAPIASGAVGALDGNATANRTTITYTINGLSIPAGTNFMVRWVDTDASGSDDGLGIDDVNFSLGCTPPTNQPTVFSFTPALQSIAGSFTAAAAGTTPADNYLILISSSPTLTDQPLSGNIYNTDDIIGNARVVSIGSSTSFTANGLTPGTTYYFFAYAVGGSSCYNTTTPLSGSTATTTPPACTPPATQASGLLAANITGTSIDISYTRGSGDNVLVIARTAEAVNAGPINSLSYTVGTEIGSGNFVVYNGSAAGFTHSGLSQNTTYYYAVYEYNSVDFCYTLSPLTGNFTTACVNPVNVSAFTAGTGNGTITLNWALPSGSCFDEIILVASTAPINGAGSTYTGTSNTVYAGGEQVVYTGTGTSVTITGLTNGTTYYFKAFTRKGVLYSAGVQVTGTPFDPATGYQYLFGNIHSHSSYSDGNKDNTTKTPADDFAFARDALCMDFLGISEHNHSGAGMNYPDFDLGYSQANAINGVAGGTSGNSIVTLWGMEWGVISGGGHVVVYGFDNQLIGWETSNYDILVAKNDYTSLWNVVNARAGAIATLAHPNSTDYTNLAGSAYSAAADNAIVGVAVESGPAFSTSTTYNDFPSQLSYFSYFKTLLAKGYHLSPQMDQDNHNLTFGTANSNRLVVLTSAKTREAIMEALRAGRYYASEDCNARVDFKTGTAVMGSQLSGVGVPSLSLNVTDPDGETVSTIDLWGGVSGSGTVPSAPLKTYNGLAGITFSSSDVENAQPDNTSYYYFAVITQADGNKMVTAPIYYSRNDLASLPLQLVSFTAQYVKASRSVLLNWTTAQEQNTKTFVVERSVDNGVNWTVLGAVDAAGYSSTVRRYQYTDASPVLATNLYRLRMVDADGRFQHSPVRSVVLGGNASQFSYNVYPNPAHGSAYLNTTGAVAETVTVRITDNSGRIMGQQQYNISSGAPARINLTGYTPGIYFIRLLTGKGVQTQKIMVR